MAGSILRLSQLFLRTLRESPADADVPSHQLLVRADRLPLRDEAGRTIWVTRARPKVVRIACPWLIRRFIDSKAVFLFVAPSERVASRQPRSTSSSNSKSSGGA